jgi:hypothetical protein
MASVGAYLVVFRTSSPSLIKARPTKKRGTGMYRITDQRMEERHRDVPFFRPQDDGGVQGCAVYGPKDGMVGPLSSTAMQSKGRLEAPHIMILTDRPKRACLQTVYQNLWQACYSGVF